MLFKDLTFYHPLFLDWRSRIYTNSNVLSYQSSELSKALIMFKDGVVLSKLGIESLQIYLANCYGFDKNSNDDRVKWTINNHDSIINFKKNPKFWLQAKEPFLFLSACFEYFHYNKNPDTFKSKLPITIDATASGLQHLAAMSNDINLAKYVNLLKSNNLDIPSDIYNEMANKIIINIKNLIDKDKDGKVFIKLALLKINRSFVKRGIMTISYGSTIKGICDQLIDGGSKQFEFVGVIKNKKLYSIIDENICTKSLLFTKSELTQLAKLIHNVLYDSYPCLKKLVNYFIEINNFIYKLDLNIPLIWKTPSGLLIEQKYVRTEQKEIKFSVLGKKKSITISKNLNKINIQKQNLSVLPNLTHSMDASNIYLLIRNIKKLDNINNILTIHDCFATNANYIELLKYYVKLAFLNIYKDNSFTENYHKDIINHLKNHGVNFNKDETEVLITTHKNKKIKNISYKLPNLPDLSKNKFLESNILFSKYFAH